MSLNEETRLGYTISPKMKEIWSLQLQMTKYILDICNKYNLRIWADGGTLLGAVRHRGYIPWDNDIDLLMPREDYDQLISLADKEFKHPYFLQCAYTDKEYYRGHAQLRLDNTTAILSYDYFKEFHQGIFVDIFCYDSIPDILDDNWNNKLKRADEIEHILGFCNYKISIFSNPKNILFRLRYLYYKYTNQTISLFREFENLFRQCHWEDSHYFGCPAFDRLNASKTTKEKEWYRETIILPFENIEVPVPIGYDKVLSKQYGNNYMTPIHITSMHGEEILFDTKKSYKEYLPLLRKERNKEFKKKRIDTIHKLLKFK